MNDISGIPLNRPPSYLDPPYLVEVDLNYRLVSVGFYVIGVGKAPQAPQIWTF